jgi:hypothetical protein
MQVTLNKNLHGPNFTLLCIVNPKFDGSVTVGQFMLMKHLLTLLTIATFFTGCLTEPATETTKSRGKVTLIDSVSGTISDSVISFDGIGASLRLEPSIDSFGAEGVYSIGIGHLAFLSYTRPGYYKAANALYIKAQSMDSVSLDKAQRDLREKYIFEVFAPNSICTLALSANALIESGGATRKFPLTVSGVQIVTDSLSITTLYFSIDYAASLPSDYSSIEFNGKRFEGVVSFNCPDPR